MMKEGYKKTDLGWIPNEWEAKEAGEIFEFSGGLSVSRENLGEEGICCLHYGDIHKRKENFIDVSLDEKWLPRLNEDYSLLKDGVKLETGDVVFADASEDYEGIGKSVSVLNYDKKPFVAGLHTIVGKDIENEIDEQYKRYCFSTKNIRKQFRRLATGTSVYGISRENIKKIKLLIPPLKEQQKIAEILSTVDSQIDDTDKLIEKNKKLKQGLMQRLFTKGIGHTKFKMTEIGEIPVEWEVETLVDISEIIMGQSPNSDTYNDHGKGIPFFQGKTEFGSVYPVVKKWCTEPTKISKPLDILISVRAPVGEVNLNKYTACIGRGLAAIRATKSNYIFIYYYLQSIKEKLNSSAQGSTFTAINSSDLKNINIAFPSLDEQKQIANILSGVDNQIEEYKNKKSKLEELKKGLIQQLLTGKIRVK